MPKKHVTAAAIEINTTDQVRLYLGQLVLGGLYGKSPAEAAERLLAHAIEELIRRGELTRLPPMERLPETGDVEE